jgi:hypothetical protein
MRKSRQIEIIFEKAALPFFIQKVKEDGWKVIYDRTESGTYLEANSDELARKTLFFVLPEHIALLEFIALETAKIFALDILQSPVVEFILPRFSESGNILHKGRLFFEPKLLNKEHLLEEKPTLFLKKAEKLITETKKKFSERL